MNITSIRLTPQQRAALEELSKKTGVSVSAMLRIGAARFLADAERLGALPMPPSAPPSPENSTQTQTAKPNP